MEELFDMSSFSSEEIKLENALRRRLIYLVDEINESSVFETIYLLDRILFLDKELQSKEDIVIRIRTNGGSVNHGLGLIGKILEMRDMGYNIICESEGMVISMGIPIMASCSVRRGHRYDVFMIHNVAAGVEGTLTRMTNVVNEAARLDRVCAQIIIDNSKITKKQIKKKTSGLDWWIDANEALALGLIDEII